MQKKAELLKVNNRTDIPITQWIKQEMNMTERKKKIKKAVACLQVPQELNNVPLVKKLLINMSQFLK